MKKLGTAYIIRNGKSRIIPLYDYSELKIVDEVLNKKIIFSINKVKNKYE